MRPRRPVSLMKKRVLLEVTSPNSSGPGGVRPSSPPGSPTLQFWVQPGRVRADPGASARIPTATRGFPSPAGLRVWIAPRVGS